MEFWGFTAWEWLVLVQHELLLFAALFFLLWSIDEFAVDLAWLWLRLTGRIPTRRTGLAPDTAEALLGPAAVFIPTWREAAIIGSTIRHLLQTWPQGELRLYVGCYRNDAETLTAAIAASGNDPRLRIVVHDTDGPTTKADCLNRLYRALQTDERRGGASMRMVVFHDAEDMVDPAALGVLDRAVGDAALVQLPVLPVPQPNSRWIGSHYCEEFAEAHGKTLVVRDGVGAAVPLAGVGCAIRRDALQHLADSFGGAPFATECLTEDYELGLGLAAQGWRTRFLRIRTVTGRLVATRAYFPDRIDTAVRQKTRWLHGIALQGWDRLGWSSSPAESWMRLRDRRGPFTALVLAAAYLLLVLAAIGWVLSLAGVGSDTTLSPLLIAILWLNLASLVWRCAVRFTFTAREYGWVEGARAVLRIPVANVIAIMAGRRALVAYTRSLFGARVEWDKTEHHAHPAPLRRRRPEPAT